MNLEKKKKKTACGGDNERFIPSAMVRMIVKGSITKGGQVFIHTLAQKGAMTGE